PPPAIAPPSVLVPQGNALGSGVGSGTISLQGIAAGFLGAGFTRMTIRNRPVAVAVAAKSGYRGSRFEPMRSGDGNAGSHFE
ncbi:MAG: hypothetical protein ACHQ2Y_07215, partial [Candidatus Lutacidiplasmatales archaeon]